MCLAGGTISLQTCIFYSTSTGARHQHRAKHRHRYTGATVQRRATGFFGEVVLGVEAEVRRVNTTRWSEFFNIGGEGEDKGGGVWNCMWYCGKYFLGGWEMI